MIRTVLATSALLGAVVSPEGDERRVAEMCGQVDPLVVHQAEESVKQFCQVEREKRHVMKGVRDWRRQENLEARLAEDCLIAPVNREYNRVVRQREAARRAVATKKLETLRASLTHTERRWMKYADRRRRAAVEGTRKLIASKKQLLSSQSRLSNPYYNIEDLKRQLHSKERRLAELEKNDPLFIPRLWRQHIKVDVMGVLKEPLRVMQVVGPTELTARHSGLNSPTLWLEGVDTSRLVTGAALTVSGQVEVVGTKTYTTAIGGSHTAFHVKSIDVDLKELAELMRQ